MNIDTLNSYMAAVAGLRRMAEHIADLRWIAQAPPSVQFERQRSARGSRRDRVADLGNRIIDATAEYEAARAELVTQRRAIYEWISGINDMRVRLICTLRVLDGMSWADVAAQVNDGYSADACNRAFLRYLADHSDTSATAAAEARAEARMD